MFIARVIILAHFEFILLFCTVSALPYANVNVDPEIAQDSYLTNQANFRGVGIQMKSDARLVNVTLASGTTCNSVRLLTTSGFVISEKPVEGGVATFDLNMLLNGQTYYIVAGQNGGTGECTMWQNVLDVDYQTEFANFSRAWNGQITESSPFISIKSFYISIEDSNSSATSIFNNSFMRYIDVTTGTSHGVISGSERNFRGVGIQMKADAALWNATLSAGTTCDTAKLLTSTGQVIAQEPVLGGVAQFGGKTLANGTWYFIVAGASQSQGECSMAYSPIDVDYQTEFVNFSKQWNGGRIEDFPLIAIDRFSISFKEVGSSIGGQSALENGMIVSVEVQGDFVKFTVPDRIDLGKVSRGFSTDEKRIDVSNSGNIPIFITLRRTSGSSIFDNLYFSRRLSGEDYEFKKVKEFGISLDKPSQVDGERSDYFYIKLDLSDYIGDIPLGVNNLDANVKFIATGI